MKHSFKLFLATVLGSSFAFASPEAIQKLLSRPERPTITELEAAMGGFPAENPFPYADYGVYGINQKWAFQTQLAMTIAQLEKAYPGAIYGGLGRDSALMADALDAFYRSVGQTGRSIHVNLSGTSMKGATEDQIWRFMRDLPGVNFDHIEDTPGFVIYDGTRFNPESQSRVLLKTLYRKLVAKGHRAGDLLRKLNFVSTAYDGYRYYPRNLIRETNLEQYFQSQHFDDKTAPEEILSVAAWGLTHGYEWSGSFLPFEERPAMAVTSRPGAATDERARVLAAMYEVMKLVRTPEFTESVNEAGRLIGVELNFKNLAQEKKLRELDETWRERDWEKLGRAVVSETPLFRAWGKNLTEADRAEMLRHLPLGALHIIVGPMDQQIDEALPVLRERPQGIETLFMAKPRDLRFVNRLSNDGRLAAELAQLSDSALNWWMDSIDGKELSLTARQQLAEHVSHRSSAVQDRFYRTVFLRNEGHWRRDCYEWLFKNNDLLSELPRVAFLEKDPSLQQRLYFMTFERISELHADPYATLKEWIYGIAPHLQQPAMFRWLLANSRPLVDVMLTIESTKRGLDPEFKALLDDPSALTKLDSALASAREKLAAAELPIMNWSAQARAPVKEWRWRDLGILELKEADRTTVLTFTSLRSAADFMSLVQALPSLEIVSPVDRNQVHGVLDEHSFGIVLPKSGYKNWAGLREKFVKKTWSDTFVLRSADNVRERNIQELLKDEGVSIEEKPKGKLFRCLRAIGKS